MSKTVDINELVKRLRDNSSEFSLMWNAADALEAMAGEVAFVKAQLAGTNKNIAGWLQARDDANLRAAVAEIERDRLKAALETVLTRTQGVDFEMEDIARKALGDTA